MTYSYKVIQEKDRVDLQYELNSYGQAGWRCVSVVYDNEVDAYVAILESADLQSTNLGSVFDAIE
jgi:hypothetical protein